MGANDEVLASLRGVHKRYGALQALAGVDLDLHSGQVLALLGPNGAGKTTTIGLLLGLLRADAGQVRLFGQDPQQVAARRGIGVMLQDAALPPTLKVGELLRLTASYYPAPRPLAESAALAGIEDLLERPYGRLSGGQQRRVQFAIALCGRPRLLFLDEPTVGLDLPARQRLWATVRMLAGEGAAVVLTTHYLEEAGYLADRVCVLLRGRIVSDGSVDALRARVETRRIRCICALDADAVAAWPGVRQVQRDGARLDIASDQAEAVVRRLLDTDPALSGLEVLAAGLDEAFCDLTRDEPVASPDLREVA
ncbi:MAG: ABC transporter ATP-binding protein [Stenotrophomonas nitritireducens]|uniref:ABC transporter ATP-binding protein n=1 Tax=Stenotrophomonas nitritireducens TaxID=83617 RepID=UPI001AD20690|nr:ABC transporter ATP-binding protein [Stenotrophomonas nitritireducens]MBN8791624.1 ABC transporter ATP-binding protein [Stenotrophomonas nitritireducens]MBN8795562.1 ABC transporter ATP-binding protein [Stenotrophomonas nitritireducens]